MYLCGIGTSTPIHRYSKAQCLQAFEESDWFERLGSRSHLIARNVLQRDNGMETRSLAVDSLDEIFAIDPNTLAARFARHAPLLAIQAGEKALANAGVRPEAIGAVIVSTCTGYLCPGLSGYVIQALGLPHGVQAYDLVGQGCAAALPNLQLAHALLASHACEHALCICVEVSSAAMYLDNDAGVLISACLFGDGAGAAVVSRRAAATGRRIQWMASESLTEPSHRTALMFEQRDGMLRNILTREVPALAAQYALQVFSSVLERAGAAPSDIRAWILHAGGRDVLLALERSLALAPNDLRYSAAVLRDYGNLSSASVFFVLQAALTDEAPSGYWWLSAFGAGFSCHGALLEVQ